MVTLSLINRPKSDPRQATGAWAPRKREMNTLQLIKARTVRNQAIETARTQMARAYRHQGHTDRVHTPVGSKTKVLRIAASPTNKSTHNSTQAVGGNCVTAASATTCTEANVPSMIEAGTPPLFYGR